MINQINLIISNIETFLLTFTGDVFEAIGWPGLTLLMALESTIIPLPSEIVMPMAGWKLVLDQNLGQIHILTAGFFGATGCLIGSLVEYYIARVGGRKFIGKFGKYVLISEKDILRAENLFEKRGNTIVLIGRMIPGVRGLISIPAGIAKMNLIKFSIFTFIGSFPWTLGLAWGGYILGNNYENIREASKPFDIPIILGILALIIFFIWIRVRDIRSSNGKLSQ